MKKQILVAFVVMFAVLTFAPKAEASPHQRSETSIQQGYTFDQIWGMYLDVQSQPGVVLGKVYDFEDYCDRPEGARFQCSFNKNDPDFYSRFYGHVYGYKANFHDGVWYYTKDLDFVEP